MNTMDYNSVEVSEIIGSLSKRLHNYFERQPISKAWLFGSRSRGDFREDSDYDILVSFDDGVGRFKYASILSDIGRYIKKRCGFSIRDFSSFMG